MANHPNRSRTCRPRELLRDFTRLYPDLFTEVARYRAEHSKEWPPWCYCPSGVAYEYVVSRTYDSMEAFHLSGDGIAMISAELAPILAAWRMGMGVYCFDPALAAALVETPATALPAEVLLMLPEWCLYVETPWWREAGTLAFFACLDYDYESSLKNGLPGLRILFDCGDDAPPVTYPLTLTAATIDESLAYQRQITKMTLERLGYDFPVETKFSRDGGALEPLLPGCISLLLYLCSTEPDYPGTDRPKNPSPVKTKKGWRLFPAASPRIWEIGRTVGERLRAAQADQLQATVDRAAPRPHLRRAHWHTYRIGQGRQGYRVRWLHPILVGFTGEND